jgi:hypothetical protein
VTLHLWRAEYGAVERDAVKRLWQTEGLLMRQKRRKRGRTDTGEDGIVDRSATREVEMRGIDFVRGHTADGHPPRMLVVRDECTRNCCRSRGESLPGEEVVRVLDALSAIHGASALIRGDNGPEFVSVVVRGERYLPRSPWTRDHPGSAGSSRASTVGRKTSCYRRRSSSRWRKRGCR